MSKIDENKQYLSLYRKYRPSDFNEVIGQNNVLKMLENSIKDNKLSHAYIFYGDRGTGKTTVARIFAKKIGSSSFDILELNAASNRKVDDIREIIESAQSSTFGSKYKVYILDEAHMLTNEAFNALLKILEEPPSHVIFILATTEKHKLPNTIISRCQTINFLSPSIDLLEDLIENVLKKENINIDQESKRKIAEEGKSSFRDTLVVLEKVINILQTNEIKINDLKNILEITKEEEVFKLLELIVNKDVKNLIIEFNKINLSTNQLIERLYKDLISFYELALYLRFINKEEISKNLNIKVEESLINKLKDLSLKYIKELSASNLYKLLELEKDLISNSNIKKSILITGVLKLITNE